MQLLFFIISIFLFVLITYYLAVIAIMTLTGCSAQQAERKLQNFLNRAPKQYRFYDDPGFAEAVWANVRGIIGNQRFRQLENLSNTAITMPLLALGINSGLPYVAISLYCNSSQEKQALESVLINVVKQYLQMSGFSQQVIADWKVRKDLNMPYLEISYYRSDAEKRIFNIIMQNRQKKIVMQNAPLLDDTEDEDIDDE